MCSDGRRYRDGTAILCAKDLVHRRGKHNSTRGMPGGLWILFLVAALAIGLAGCNNSSGTTSTAPTITSLSRTAVVVGASITITGTNFGTTQGTSTVTFNGTSAGTASAWSATSITVTVPAGATPGNVVVTVGGQASNGSPFTIIPPPSITSLNRTSVVAGATITITGTNFGTTQGTSLATTFFAQTPSSNGDFTYVANPPRVTVSPSTVIPASVPYCSSGSLGSLICYSPDFLRAAYNFPSGLDGHGQTILIVDAFGSPTIQNDLAVFDRTFGVPDPPSFTVLCPAGCPSFNPRNAKHDEFGWTVETSLDVEYAHAMAPGAQIVLVVAPASSGNAINTVEAAAIAQFPGSVMSQSFGIPEILVHGDNTQILQAEKNYAAAQQAGITVLASTGDFGATNGFTIANASFPASDPLNTAVGGTEGNPYLATGTAFTCASGATCTSGLATFTGPCSVGPRPSFPGCTPVGYGAEQVWNEGNLSPPAATGSAPSLFFPVPSYQKGLSLTSRTIPDISYNAAVNGGVLVYYTALGAPTWFVVGGTSAGSPQWAGIVALANQSSTDQGHGPLGLINPALYKLAESSAYSADFHDVKVGNNELAGTPVGFGAEIGYDLATGWGTPNVGNMVEHLVACAKTTSCP